MIDFTTAIEHYAEDLGVFINQDSIRKINALLNNDDEITYFLEDTIKRNLHLER